MAHVGTFATPMCWFLRPPEAAIPRDLRLDWRRRRAANEPPQFRHILAITDSFADHVSRDKSSLLVICCQDHVFAHVRTVSNVFKQVACREHGWRPRRRAETPPSKLNTSDQSAADRALAGLCGPESVLSCGGHRVTAVCSTFSMAFRARQVGKLANRVWEQKKEFAPLPRL